MTSRSIGFVIAVAMVLASTAAHAQPGTARQFSDGDITYTVTRSAAKVLLRAEGRGARLEKSASRDGIYVFVGSSTDAFELSVSSRAVQVKRGGQEAVVQFDQPHADHSTELQEILRNSDASKALDRLAAAADASARPEAASVLATLALVRALEGDPTGNRLLAEKLRRRQKAVVVRQAAQRTREGEGAVVDACWEEYQRVLDRNLVRYDACLRDYWWLQPVQYACGLEFAMVAELAMFRLISCVGGMPV